MMKCKARNSGGQCVIDYKDCGKLSMIGCAMQPVIFGASIVAVGALGMWVMVMIADHLAK